MPEYTLTNVSEPTNGLFMILKASFKNGSVISLATHLCILKSYNQEMVSNLLHLKSLNHISIVCQSVERFLEFYQNVLGFFAIRRPNSFEFDGAWIHLLQSEDPENMPQINPKDNHISFQCESMAAVEKKLQEKQKTPIRDSLFPLLIEFGGIGNAAIGKS